MKCKFCSSLEELKWPENYKKGQKPVNADTNQPHICIGTPKNEFKKAKWKRVNCPNCSKPVIHNVNHPNYDPESPCTTCKEHHELIDK